VEWLTDYSEPEELAPGEMWAVQVSGVAMLVGRMHDRSFRAVRDLCEHLGVPLSRKRSLQGHREYWRVRIR
jgi:phenylpropionate dioxygenase-like ring-hydroxylating dioxygenase large terminal subunit